MNLQPAPSLVKFAQFFYQGSLSSETDLDEFAANALANLSTPEVKEMKVYLKRLLDEGASNDDLKEVWKRCHSNYVFMTPITFFTMIIATAPKRQSSD